MNRQLKNAQKGLERMMGRKNMRMASNVVSVLLVLVAVLLVPHLQLNALSWLDNTIARAVLMVVIVVVCLFDPVVALLLAILFVVSLQRLHKLKKEKNSKIILDALNTVVNNNLKINVQDNVNSNVNSNLNNSVNNVNGEELVEDELPSVESQLNVLPPHNGVNSEVVLAEVNPANMNTNVEYNLTPNVIENAHENNVGHANVPQRNNDSNVKVNVVNNMLNNNPNTVGSLLEEGSENVLSANNTEHFLSVENAAGNQNNVLTARIVCRKSGFENDAELVSSGNVNNRNNNSGNVANLANAANNHGVPGVINNRPHCKPFTSQEQFKDAQSNLVQCVGNKQQLATQGHGNLNSAPKGVQS